jgi:hypothetical protein
VLRDSTGENQGPDGQPDFKKLDQQTSGATLSARQAQQGKAAAGKDLGRFVLAKVTTRNLYLELLSYSPASLRTFSHRKIATCAQRRL